MAFPSVRLTDCGQASMTNLVLALVLAVDISHVKKQLAGMQARHNPVERAKLRHPKLLKPVNVPAFSYLPLPIPRELPCILFFPPSITFSIFLHNLPPITNHSPPSSPAASTPSGNTSPPVYKSTLNTPLPSDTLKPMPHAERDFENSTMTANGTVDGHLTNGEKPQSLTIQHLTSYPFVSDTIKVYGDNPYGAKSISLIQEAYIRFVHPVEPYLKTPISYVAPYLAKADSLGDEGLKKVDEKFPMIKEETASLKEKAQGVASLPLKYATDGKEYLLGTYQDEYKRTGGQGVVTTIKAILSTELKVTQDVLQYIADALAAKKQEAKKVVDEKANN